MFLRNGVKLPRRAIRAGNRHEAGWRTPQRTKREPERSQRRFTVRLQGSHIIPGTNAATRARVCVCVHMLHLLEHGLGTGRLRVDDDQSADEIGACSRGRRMIDLR